MPAGARLTLSSRDDGGTVILDLAGDLVLDRETRRLREEVERLLDAGRTRILLNFTRVRHLDSMGAGVLVVANNLAKERGAHLKLCGLSGSARQMLERLQLHTVLDLYDEEPQALASFQ